MPTVGTTLAAERVRQRLDLEDIARVTKLTPKALQAIEAEDFEQLPGLIFARNFVRQYAEALKLDATGIVRQFEREQSFATPEFSVAEMPRPVFEPRINGSAFRGVFASDAASAFTTFVLTLGLCGATFYAYEYWRSHQSVSPTPAEYHAQRSRQRMPVKAQTPPVQPESAPAVPTSTPVPAQVSNNGSVHVQLIANGECWARITVDGKVVFTGTLAAGNTRTLDAASEVTIRAGNAGALALKLNGNDVPGLGPSGQIRTISLTPTGAHVRTPSPELLSDF